MIRFATKEVALSLSFIYPFCFLSSLYFYKDIIYNRRMDIHNYIIWFGKVGQVNPGSEKWDN